MSVGERLVLAARRNEPPEVQRTRDEAAVSVVMHRLAQLGEPARLSVRRERHHLVLVGAALEADVHRQLLIAQAERVGKRDAPQHLEFAAAHDAGEIRRLFAAPVHDHDRAVAIRAREIGRRRMRDVMRDEANLRPIEARQRGSHESRRSAHEVRAQRFVLVVVQRGAVRLREIGIVRVGDRIEIRRFELREAERPACRLFRQLPRREGHANFAVLAPREALLFGGGDDRAVDDQRDGGIVKDRIDPKDSHSANRFPTEHKRGNPLRCSTRRAAERWVRNRTDAVVYAHRTTITFSADRRASCTVCAKRLVVHVAREPGCVSAARTLLHAQPFRPAGARMFDDCGVTEGAKRASFQPSARLRSNDRVRSFWV